MKIAVCLKQVPSRDWQPRVNDQKTWVRDQDAAFELNEPDAYALEEGLRLKEKHGGEVVVFDRNLAFEAGFDASQFLDSHVFAADLVHLASDWVARQQVRQGFEAALHCLPEACATIPDAWRFADAEQTVPAAWSLPEMVATLERCRIEQTFWNLTS